MPIIKYADWLTAVNANAPLPGRSQQLRDVTTAFEQYSTNPSQPRLETLSTNFQTWRTTQTVKLSFERGKLGAQESDLEFTITKAKQANVVINVKATNVGQVGWTYQAWDPAVQNFTTAVPVPQRQPALTPSQIARVNESFRRSIKAVELARDALIAIAQKATLPAPGSRTPAEQSYVDYFGAYNQAQAKKVLENFKVLHLAFTRSPTVIDLRNTLYGLGCYAACYRANLVTKDAKGQLSLTAPVRMFLGRVFLTRGDYESSTDTTVGTLVHEFAHGAFAAVDAPIVLANNSWHLTPAHEGDPTHEDYGETPQNQHQSSTVELDKRLALKSATIAQRNADSYGQFAKEAILRAVA